MTQRDVYTKVFVAVLPVILEKLNLEPTEVANGSIGTALDIAANIAWRASFKWCDNMQTFMEMDADESIAGTPDESLVKIDAMSWAEYKMGFKDLENN